MLLFPAAAATTTILLVISVGIDASADYRNSRIIDFQDVLPGNGKTFSVNCVNGCRIYATITGSTAYEQQISLVSPDNNVMSTLANLAVAYTDNAGLKTPLNYTGQLFVTNMNTAVDRTRPYYILVVNASVDTSRYAVYEAATVNFTTTLDGITLMSASSFFTVSSFNVGTATGLQIFPGAYDFAQGRGVLINVESPVLAAATLFPSFTPVVTIFAPNKPAAGSLSFSVNTNAVTSWTVPTNGTFVVSSPGYSNADHALSTILPNAQKYHFDYGKPSEMSLFVDRTLLSANEQIDIALMNATANNAPTPYQYSSVGATSLNFPNPTISGMDCSFTRANNSDSDFVVIVAVTSDGSGLWILSSSLLVLLAAMIF